MTAPTLDVLRMWAGSTLNRAHAMAQEDVIAYAERLERQRDALADALRTIRDSTHKNAITLRGIADYALAEVEAKT